jgi:hypothetical protein
MQRKWIIIAGVVIVLVIVAGAAVVYSANADPMSGLRGVTSQYQQTDRAKAAGYDLQPKLDHCFNNPGVGAMGFHYIKPTALDVNVNPLEPEAIVYAPRANGQMELAAVEYIVPAANWDALGTGKLPSAWGQNYHLNKDLGIYVLHAWIWKNNPKGMFEDWNPTVTCP